MIAAALAAWVMFLAVDFLLHAVIFSSWWKATEHYWLSPSELFRLIPYAYASFAIYCVALTWLFVRIFRDKRTLGIASRFGAFAGLIFGVSISLANYSVFLVPSSTLLVWTVSYSIESTVACTTSQWVLDTERPWRRVGLVFGVAILILIVSVVFQNLLSPV